MFRHAPVVRPVLLGAAALVASLVLGCRSSPDERLQQTPEQSRHAVHDERLQRIMHELELFTGERLPQELDLAAQRQQRVDEISSIAQAMAVSADDIPQALQSTDMPAGDRKQFDGLAERLRDLSMTLHAEAADLSLPELRARFAVIRETCNGCHQRFRFPAAPR